MNEGELWSWVRSVMAQGASIQQDYAAGTHKTYEHYSARLDAAARERADELAARLKLETVSTAHSRHVQAHPVANAEFCPHCNPCRNGERIAKAERLNEAYDAVLRGLACYVGAGGFNDLQRLIEPQIADDKIRWGIDHMLAVEHQRNHGHNVELRGAPGISGASPRT